MNMKLPYTIKNYWINVGASFLIATATSFLIGLLVGSDNARFVYLLLAVYWILIEIRRIVIVDFTYFFVHEHNEIFLLQRHN